MATALALGFLVPSPWAPYAAFAGLVLAPAALGRVLVSFLRRMLPVVLPIAVSIILVQGFFWPHGTPLLTPGCRVPGCLPSGSMPWLSLKREGLAFAFSAIGRLLLASGGVIFLTLTTAPSAIMDALEDLGCPHALGYLVLASLQLVGRLRARAAAVLDAQQARGLRIGGSSRWSSAWRRGRALVPLALPLVLGAVLEVEERAMALEARGFSRPGPRTRLTVLPDTPAERWLRRVLLVVVVVAIAWRVAMVRVGS